MKKVYFSGSIRGGREDIALYAELIRGIGEYAEVLTEFIGDSTLEDQEADTMTDADIYERDVALERRCDLVIAECTTPSLGVGYELAYAEALGKPVIILFREESGRRLSAMLSGNPRFTVFGYRTAADALNAVIPYLMQAEK